MVATMSYLSDLLAATRKRVDEAKRTITEEVLEQRIAALPAPRPLEARLRGGATGIIAEIKRASPSAGDLDLGLNAGGLAAAYASGGAAALSVLTEPDFFRGSLEDLEAAVPAGPPVLRKDFILESFQVLESRAVGADAVLLIARVLGDRLPALLEATRAAGLEALVEVVDEAELGAAEDAGASLVGVNHRDLTSFEIDPGRTARLAARAAASTTIVALSGVSTRSEVEALGAAGASAVLVGEALVTADDPAAKLEELLGTGS